MTARRRAPGGWSGALALLLWARPAVGSAGRAGPGGPCGAAALAAEDSERILEAAVLLQVAAEAQHVSWSATAKQPSPSATAAATPSTGGNASLPQGRPQRGSVVSGEAAIRSSEKSKAVLLALEMIPLCGFLGMDRFYLGCMGTAAAKLFVSFITGGIGGSIWNFLDCIFVTVNALQRERSINVFGLRAGFRESDLEAAHALAVVNVALLSLNFAYYLLRPCTLATRQRLGEGQRGRVLGADGQAAAAPARPRALREATGLLLIGLPCTTFRAAVALDGRLWPLRPADDEPEGRPSCAVCLSTFADETPVRATRCGHVFCAACLEQHVLQSPAGSRHGCPVCRSPLAVVGSGAASDRAP